MGFPRFQLSKLLGSASCLLPKEAVYSDRVTVIPNDGLSVQEYFAKATRNRSDKLWGVELFEVSDVMGFRAEKRTMLGQNQTPEKVVALFVSHVNSKDVPCQAERPIDYASKSVSRGDYREHKDFAPLLQPVNG